MTAGSIAPRSFCTGTTSGAGDSGQAEHQDCLPTITSRTIISASPPASRKIRRMTGLDPPQLILSAAMMLDWLSDKHGDERCANAAASIRTATGAILETGPKIRDRRGWLHLISDLTLPTSSQP